jgi:flagellar protein FliS
MSSGFAKYRENQVESHTPAETVLMLYDGAINFIRKALIELNEHDNIPGKALLLDKTVVIIDYLYTCLDRDKGGEIAENLHKLYEYMMVRLAEANMKNDTEKMEEVINMLLTLREGWCKISRNDNNRAKAEAVLQHTGSQQPPADINTAAEPPAARKIQIKI